VLRQRGLPHQVRYGAGNMSAPGEDEREEAKLFT
jgi:hypothetical protein